MTQIMNPLPEPSESEQPDAAITAARAELLTAVFAAFGRHGITYCVSHGYSMLPQTIASDVDMIVAANQLPKVRVALSDLGASGRLVQWMNDGAIWAVVAGQGAPGRPAIVQLHLSRSFGMAGSVFYTAEELLVGRRNRGEFYIPAQEIEFACVCINRSIKGHFRPDHLSQVHELLQQNPSGCARELQRFFSAEATQKLLTAASTNNAAELSPPLASPIAPPSLNTAPMKWVRKIGQWKRRTARWARPRNGIHLVFLGPDGVGKSTVIDAIREAALPAFLRTDYQTFAPSLIPGPLQPKKDTPHQLPPRSRGASYVKAAWWSVCYTAGYYVSVRPASARASLVLNHRYLLDAMVDPKRYRYSGPQWPLKIIWRIAPKPDLIFLLDAPAEVIQSRKKEVPAAETARQREGYRALIGGLKNARIIDTHRPLPIVADEVLTMLFDLMAARTAKQGGSP